MLSLYLHIPFCSQKCAYCSFTSFPVNGIQNLEFRIENYLNSLKTEIKHYGEIFPGEEIKTIYIGGGTPNLIGAENLIMLIEEIKKYFNTESLAELSFEFNPFPQEEMYSIVKKINEAYAKESRVRFSFGIQSLDDEVLKSAGRPSSFGEIVSFLRGLQEYKQENNVFNFDFIAFGKFNETRSGNFQLRDQNKIKFFESFVHSGLADSFSLYTLELSEGSKRFNNLTPLGKGEAEPVAKQGDLLTGDIEKDNLIFEEFQILKEVLLEAGYHRYEISNFAHSGKTSIHNMAYRTMENYLGLGLNASSYLDKEHTKVLSSFATGRESFRVKEEDHEVVEDFGLRHTNTKDLNKYINGERLNKSSTIEMTHKDYLIEKFFLKLRTNQGIKDLSEFTEILVPNYQEKIKNYEKEGFIEISSATRDPRPSSLCRLTDAGMDVFNTIVTDLMQEI